jgi:hypothetical protein
LRRSSNLSERIVVAGMQVAQTDVHNVDVLGKPTRVFLL